MQQITPKPLHVTIIKVIEETCPLCVCWFPGTLQWDSLEYCNEIPFLSAFPSPSSTNKHSSLLPSSLTCLSTLSTLGLLILRPKTRTQEGSPKLMGTGNPLFSGLLSMECLGEGSLPCWLFTPCCSLWMGNPSPGRSCSVPWLLLSQGFAFLSRLPFQSAQPVFPHILIPAWHVCNFPAIRHLPQMPKAFRHDRLLQAKGEKKPNHPFLRILLLEIRVFLTLSCRSLPLSVLLYTGYKYEQSTSVASCSFLTNPIHLTQNTLIYRASSRQTKLGIWV